MILQRLLGPARGGTVAAGQRIVNIYGNFTGTINMGDQVDESRKQLERERLIEKVRKLVEEPLKDQLRGTHVFLTLEYCPGVVGGPSDLDNPEVGPLPPGTTIGQVFQAQEQKLLLLGEGGSGKTTALRTLALDLIDRVKADPRRPVPLVFSLASWGKKHRRLADWLVDELGQAGPYDQNRDRASSWVVEEQFLPLLLGLDEVEPGQRHECVEAINEFRASRKWVREMAITSCTDDYEALRPTQLNLHAAVRLCPLSAEQIDDYLTSRGLEGLQAAIASDATLLEMATSPLTLSFMASAFEDRQESGLPEVGTAEERHARLVGAYVDNRFRIQEPNPPYLQEQARQWLGWLAGSLQDRKEPAFYLDRLQPDWLPTMAAHRWYAVVDRIGTALVVAGAFGLLFGLHFVARYGPGLALVGGLVGALVGGLLGGQGEATTGSKRDLGTIARGALSGFAAVAMVSGLIVVLAAGPSSNRVPIAVVLGALVGALVGGLAGGPGFRGRPIALRGPLGWSPILALRHAAGGLVIGGLFGGLFGLLGIQTGMIVLPGRSGPGNDPLVAALLAVSLTALLFGLLLALGFGLVGGLVAGIVEEEALPNQAVRRSARRALFVFSWVTLVSSLAVGVLLVFLGGSSDPEENLPFATQGGLLVGPILGLVAALAFGGYACLSHLALRLVLWRCGVLPVNCIAFLEYAKRCDLLSRVGGGYEFRPGLAEHFAAREAGTAAPRVTA